MKFRFANIGPITEAEMDLGDLTIIAGRNNTGKTYLAYTLYGFLKKWQSWPNIVSYMQEHARYVSQQEPSAKIIDIVQMRIKLMEEERYECPMDGRNLRRYQQGIINRIARDFSKMQIAKVFSTSRDNFENSAIKVDFERSDSGEFPSRKYEYVGDGVISVEYDGEKLIFSMDASKEKRFSKDAIETRILSICARLLLMELPAPFIVSAERLGISLFYKELDFTKNRLVEILQDMGNDKSKTQFSPHLFLEQNASRYALPIKDNIDYTRDISHFVKVRGRMHGEKLYDNVKKIMGGYYKSDANEIRFVSSARKHNRFDIPLHLASSSARGLSSLYFYLRHTAVEGDMLIIDEPESHLDTKNQIMLARMLAHFVRNHIKVLITTHSDYLIKEINNLVMLSNSFEGKTKFIKKHKYNQDEFLSPENLRCYIAERGRLTRCGVDKFGVDMPIFDETIDDINKVSNELFARIEDGEDK